MGTFQRIDKENVYRQYLSRSRCRKLEVRHISKCPLANKAYET